MGWGGFLRIDCCSRTICYCFLEIFVGDRVAAGGIPIPPKQGNPCFEAFKHNNPKVCKKIKRGKSNAKRNGKHGVHGHRHVSCNFLYVK